MFIAALFAINKSGSNPTIHQQTIVYIHTMKIFSLKKGEILTFAATCMNFKDIMVSEIKPVTKELILYDFTYMKYLEQIHRDEVEWWLQELEQR